MAKKFDFKAVLINHGEKFVAGIVVLLGLFALSSASWSGYDKTPEEMQLLAEKTDKKMEEGTMSDEEKAKFAATPDVRRMARQIAEETTDREKYATNRPWNEPLHRINEKRSSVAVIAPFDPETSVVSVAIALPPKTEEDDKMTKSMEDEKKEEDLTDDEKARLKELKEKYGEARGGVAGIGGYPGGSGGYPGGSGGYPGGSGGYPGGSAAVAGGSAAAPGGGYPGGSGGYPGGGAAAPGGGYPGGSGGYPGGSGGYPGGSGGYPGGGGGDAGGGDGGMMMMMMGGMGMGGPGYGYGAGVGGTKVTKRVRLSVGASVRLVVDLREQRKAISDALHIPASNVQATQRYISYVELHVERKEAIAGPDPWAGEWEPLRREDYAEILTESLGVDRDIVAPAVTRNTITMPLPRRAAGVWRAEEASHNRLENFELSPEEQDLINKMNELILERAEEAREMLPPMEAEQRGFTEFVRDVNQIQQATANAYGGEDAFFSGIVKDIESGLGENKKLTDKEKQVLDTSRATAEQRLLLVRFMDFTVDRGKTYQYRVRLEMRNPNFNVPLDRLEQPELATQKTLMSDWSQPTEPVAIPMEYRYYVAKVDAGSRPGTQERVDFPIFFENTDTGMPVMGDVKVPVGMPIGGFQKHEVVNLAEETLDNEDVHFRTRDLLAAAIEAPKPSASDHPDLAGELNSIPRSEKAIPDRVIVVEYDGTLAMRAVGDRNAQEQDDSRVMKAILENYDAWRQKAASAADGLFGGADGGSAGMGAMMGMGMGGGNAMAGRGFGYGGSGGKKMDSRERARQRRENQGAVPGLGGSGGYPGTGN
ncbi:MAG: hypothetical protein R3C19_12430 [Planctomycetaceae bacterium]